MKDDFYRGWEFAARVVGADLAGARASADFSAVVSQNQQIAIQNQHIQEINDAVDDLARSINEHPYRALGIDQFKGYVAEEFHAGTFNVEAIRQGSAHRAFTLQDHGYGSVDIDTNFGRQYSLKYANTPQDAERYQAVLDRDTGLPLYRGQERLIAGEQVEQAREWAKRRANKDILTRPEVVASHTETGERLVGNVSDGDGVESHDLPVDEAKVIAREGKKGEFDPEKHGVAKEAYITEARIAYLNQAMKAGLTAATITAMIQLVPELFKTIDYLIKYGEIDLNQINRSGAKIITASGEAFLRGSIAYTVQLALQKGLFGETLKNVTPTMVGVVVTLVLGTIKDSIMVATGKITAAEMGMHFADSVIISGAYAVGAKIGGVIGQVIGFKLPGLGYLIGSLIGTSIAVVYNIGKKKMISFCVDTGFTCFGLVEQNYELPEMILEKMGIELIPISRTEIAHIPLSTTSVCAKVNRVEYETIDISFVRRGVIGVNKIGCVV